MLSLHLKDLDLNTTPTQIHIRGETTKSGNPRVAFISNEATEIVREWLNIREAATKTVKRRSAKSKPSLTKEDPRLFPFTQLNAYAIWNNALDKAKLNGRDRNTNIREFHPHVLRKFFRSRMATVVALDIVEALMGHQGYLTEAYRRYTIEQLAKCYQRGEATLSVFTDMEEVSKLRQEVEERNKTLQTLVNGLTRENMELKEKMTTVESQMGVVSKQLENLEPTKLETENRILNQEVANLKGQYEKLEDLVFKLSQELGKKSKDS